MMSLITCVKHINIFKADMSRASSTRSRCETKPTKVSMRKSMLPDHLRQRRAMRTHACQRIGSMRWWQCSTDHPSASLAQSPGVLVYQRVYSNNQREHASADLVRLANVPEYQPAIASSGVISHFAQHAYHVTTAVERTNIALVLALVARGSQAIPMIDQCSRQLSRMSSNRGTESFEREAAAAAIWNLAVTPSNRPIILEAGLEQALHSFLWSSAYLARCFQGPSRRVWHGGLCDRCAGGSR